MELTCAVLDRLHHALSRWYPDSFYLLVEWFSDYDHDGFMLHEIMENGYIPVIDLPTGPTQSKYEALAFLVSLGFELKRRRGEDIVHYHQVPPDVMFQLRHYIRQLRNI